MSVTIMVIWPSLLKEAIVKKNYIYHLFFICFIFYLFFIYLLFIKMAFFAELTPVNFYIGIVSIIVFAVIRLIFSIVSDCILYLRCIIVLYFAGW